MAENILIDLLTLIFSILIFPPFGIALLAVLINIAVERVPRRNLQVAVLVALAILMAAVEPVVGREILATLPASLLVRTFTLLHMVGIVATSLIPFAVLRERYTRRWQWAYVFGGTSIVILLYLLQGIAPEAVRPPPAETYLDFVIQNLSHYPEILLYAIAVYAAIAVIETERRKDVERRLQEVSDLVEDPNQ